MQACSSDYVPKPKAYPRIIFPAHSYQNYTNPNCPFSFDIPTYASIAKNKDKLNGNRLESDCWADINFNDFNATLYCSYKQITANQTLPQLVNDAYKMSMKHSIRADFIDDSLIVTPNKTYGLWYDVGGNAATSTLFFLTDSVEHFLWASFYVKNTPNADSIAPVVQFIRDDIKHMITTFKWE